MTIQDLGSLGELIAAVATVATLGYLAFQLRLNNIHSRAYTQRDLLNQVVLDHEKATKMPAITRRGLNSFEDLDENEKLEFAGVMVSLVARFETALRLYRSGLLDDVLFRSNRAWVLSWLTTPGGLQWWKIQGLAYAEDVRQYINRALDEKIDLPAPITESASFYGQDDERQ